MPDSGFWGNGEAEPVERRILFGFAGKRGELIVRIIPNRTVPDLAGISERMMLEATVPAVDVTADGMVAPQFVFAEVRDDGGKPVVHGPDHRAISLLHFPGRRDSDETIDYAEKLEQTKAALPPAPIKPGDGAIGFLVRTDVLHFYPLVRVPKSEHAHFHEGAGSSDDLIHALPYQAN